MMDSFNNLSEKFSVTEFGCLRCKPAAGKFAHDADNGARSINSGTSVVAVFPSVSTVCACNFILPVTGILSGTVNKPVEAGSVSSSKIELPKLL
ncbi:MAG: hypothetical protein BWY67_01167 [Bacteroidetes bacterium ADurb.Bin397]|nr:MAG: hypothetical protein BWY67_01167 [Bacteroidetes bacterium ADurb.Bin397]